MNGDAKERLAKPHAELELFLSEAKRSGFYDARRASQLRVAYSKLVKLLDPSETASFSVEKLWESISRLETADVGEASQRAYASRVRRLIKDFISFRDARGPRPAPAGARQRQQTLPFQTDSTVKLPIRLPGGRQMLVLLPADMTNDEVSAAAAQLVAFASFLRSQILDEIEPPGRPGEPTKQGKEVPRKS